MIGGELIGAGAGSDSAHADNETINKVIKKNIPIVFFINTL
jgi:hypothetical protein